MALDDVAHSPRRVVVPVDGSLSSTRSFPLAARLASVLGSELVVVSVVADFRTEGPTRVERIREQLQDVPESIDRRIVQAGKVAATIAEESAGGLVCIATSAEPFDAEGIRHTVTDGLIAAATSPVIAIGPKCVDDPEIDRIVVAIDPSHDQAGLSYWATRLGYQLDVPIDFVHVVESDGPTSGSPKDLGPKIRTLTCDSNQSVSDRLLIESDGALLALGSHGHTGFRRLIRGSVGAAVISNSTRPVLILGPNAERAPATP